MSGVRARPIRRARPADAAALFPLAVELATSFVPERAAFTRAFRDATARRDACVLVAERDGRIVGYLLGFEHPAFFANGRVAWIEEVAVAAGLRRGGIGRALVTAFERWARSRRARLVALATRRAGAFYRALGYEESATYFRKVF